MANLACGNRLSLRNQYDTKTPRASVFLFRPSNGRRFPQGCSSPVPRETGTCSRHEKIYSVGFEISVENFFRKRNRKISRELPNHCRTCAAFTQPSQFKRSTWAGGPQAVLKDSCLGNTLRQIGGAGCDTRPLVTLHSERGACSGGSMTTRQIGLRRQSGLRSLAGTGNRHRR
jgi:hypothetical protein